MERSDFGPGQRPFAQTDVIEQQGQAIRINVAFEDETAKGQHTITFVTDGKEIDVPETAREPGSTAQAVSAFWEGSVLVLRQRLDNANGRGTMTGTSRYTLSPDGNLLTIKQDFATQRGKTSRTLVFDKANTPTNQPTVGGGVAMASPSGERLEKNELSQDVSLSDNVKSVGYAIRATLDIRDIMVDPTSFTLLQVIAITKREKDGSTSFRGCVHYVAGNRMGGREQAWGGYSVNKKHPLEVKSWPGGEDTEFECYVHKNEIETDVTAEIEEYLSEH